MAQILVLCSSTVVAQDRCFQAIPIGNGNTVGSNIGATVGGSDFYATCTTSSMGSDVWYSYVATCSGNVNATFCSGGGTADFDTLLVAWDGSCGCAALVFLACDDDHCGLKSHVTFTAAAGQLYYLEVGGANGAQGNFTLHVNCTPGVPTNDEWMNAIYINEDDKVVGTNVGATTSLPIGSCGNIGNDVWYYFFPTANGNCTVSTCQPVTNFDTVVTVWSLVGGSLTEVACNDDACGTPGHSLNSTVTFPAVTQTFYFVSVGGYSGATGTFGLKISRNNSLRMYFFDEGPGTMGYRVAGESGYDYMFATLTAGAFPNDWFFGIDISVADLTTQLNAGVPFNGPLTSCGVVGPFGGLPSGLTVYAVALRTHAAGGSPTAVSYPNYFTVP